MSIINTEEEKRFLSRWLLANLISWPLGIIIAIGLSYAVVNIIYAEETNLIVGVCLGGCVSFAQWLVLKKYLEIPKGWILAAMTGIGIPFFVGSILYAILGDSIRIIPSELLEQVALMLIGGLITGLLQYRLLSACSRKYRSWILISTISWGLGWPGLFFGGLVYAVLSWIGIVVIMQIPIQAISEEGDPPDNR